MVTFKNCRFTLVVAAFAAVMSAHGDLYDFSAVGGGVTITGWFLATPTIYADTDQITALGGMFTDTNVGISGNITGLESTPVLGPAPFLPGPPSSQGFSFDNLFYPDGNSPVVCTDYGFGGGLLDAYGVVFDIKGGYSACMWSDGTNPYGLPEYDVADAGPTGMLDYPNPKIGLGVGVNFTVNAVPEPSSFAFLGAGVLGLCVSRRRKR